jgi:hypothetical protein
MRRSGVCQEVVKVPSIRICMLKKSQGSPTPLVPSPARPSIRSGLGFFCGRGLASPVAILLLSGDYSTAQDDSTSCTEVLAAHRHASAPNQASLSRTAIKGCHEGCHKAIYKGLRDGGVRRGKGETKWKSPVIPFALSILDESKSIVTTRLHFGYESYTPVTGRCRNCIARL